jgi:hypothetical protein
MTLKSLFQFLQVFPLKYSDYSEFNVECKYEVKMGPFLKKNKDGVDFRYFWKRRHFENNLFELGAVNDTRLPIFILIRFWEIRKFLTNGLYIDWTINSTDSIW